MLAPLSWLKKYVDINLPVDAFVDKMIMTSSEVEGWHRLNENISNVVVGRIAGLKAHPGADKLKLCMMDIGGSEPVQVVTGADNVYEGAYVPVALVGAKLPNGLEIKKSVLRGEPSMGMLCSGEELRIDDSVYPGASVNGILILREKYAPGTDIAEVLGMDDVIIDFKTYPNRPDCLSVVGMAREAAAALDSALKMPAIDYTEGGEPVGNYVSVEVADKELCPRYMARIVTDIKIEPSPQWMQRELTAAGVRPINNIVDITNYVMLEMGQPMHAFDFRYVEGGRIIVRRARAGETITTLDGIERVLTPEMLVICDAQKPSAVAGIMGGEYSGIYDDTKTVLFESALFDGPQTRRTSRALGLRTESSSRFEKGLPASNTEKAMDRAMHLIEELRCGTIARGCVDIKNISTDAVQMSVSVRRINNLLGLGLFAEEMQGILRRLQIETQTQGDALVCTLPPHRMDLANEADIAEEIMRIYGYDSIPSIIPEGSMASGGRSQAQRMKAAVRRTMTGQGLFEAMSYSFVSPSALDMLMLTNDDGLRDTITILNPLGEDYSVMRTTLVPSMLQSLVNNLNRGVNDVRLFEIARTYHPNPGTELPNEIDRLCLGISAKDEDFYSVKGRLEQLLSILRIGNVTFAAEGPVYLHPGRKANIYSGSELLGSMGELHPDIADRYDFRQRIYLAEISLNKLLEVRTGEVAVKPLPKYPASARDIAVLMDREQPVGPVLDAIRKACDDILESVELFDIYQGNQLQEGKKSVAFAMVFRAPDRTLTDADVNKRMDKIISMLEHKYKARLRE